jgi:hypothetical protein
MLCSALSGQLAEMPKSRVTQALTHPITIANKK